MASFERIRSHGFRQWYERQLIECHAWLVTCFLGIIAVASGMEVFGVGGASARLVGGLLIVSGIIASIYSWRRYRSMLAIAERLGEHATCPACQSYGKFEIVDSGPTPLPDGSDPDLGAPGKEVWLRARCRKCERQWLL